MDGVVHEDVFVEFLPTQARPWTRRVALSNSSCGASARRGYLAAGKLTRRWSASSTQTRRPSIQQRRAVVSAGMEGSISGEERIARLLAGAVILSGKDGEDAQPYQEKQIRKAIRATMR